MKRFKLILSIVIISGILASCTKVQKVGFEQSLEHPEDAHPAPIKFDKLKTRLPVGAEIGIHRTKCFLSFYDVGRHYLRGNINQTLIDDIFAETLEAQGFDIVSRLNIVFDEEYEGEFLRSEYKVGGKIIDAQIDACGTPNYLVGFSPFKIFDPLYLGISGFKGKLYLKIEWAVYDSLRRKVVYKTTTEGYVHRKAKNKEGITLMVNEAFSMAAHNLAADENFHDLIFYGTKPPQGWRKKKKKESRPRIFAPREEVTIFNKTLSKTPLTKHIERTRKVAVLVQAGAGHGSGYFISKQGHIITNAHVVGDAMRVRVVSANNDKKMIAEVLRKSDKRDVALLKLEEIPESLNIVTLPIRNEFPRVSEDIYALGAPQMRKLMDTLSKGIVSAHRKNFGIHGAKLDFIQGDVAVHGGNSGGPLLDGNGNIVGMSVSGYMYNEFKADDGLNLFIPINDALRYLNIELE